MTGWPVTLRYCPQQTQRHQSMRGSTGQEGSGPFPNHMGKVSFYPIPSWSGEVVPLLALGRTLLC